MAKQGAIGAVLAGLEHHPEDEGVQVYGCWALGCLARTAANKVYLDAEHAIARFFTLLRSYSKDRLVEFGCNTLVFFVELSPGIPLSLARAV
jgi:hypothetical protein